MPNCSARLISEQKHRWHIPCRPVSMRHLRTIIILAATLLKAQAALDVPSEIPFTYREGLIWLHATIGNPTNQLNLLLDTGAGASVLNTSTAERLGLKFGRAVSVQGVECTLTGHWLKPVSVSASGVQLPANYLAIDLAKLSSSCQRPLDGLVGADFFRGRNVQIDFDAHTIRLLPQSKAAIIADSVPLQFRPCGVRVRIAVNGSKTQWVRLDTGCASALQWVTSKVRSEDCIRKAGIGLTDISIPQTLTTVQLGSREFQNVPTGLHKEPIFCGEAGLLGNDLLSRFSRITIDARAGRLLLEPHPTAALP